MTFNDVIGQEEVKQRLMKMAEEQRVPHAILLCGPAGSGKLPLALAFACHLLHQSPMLGKWAHPDLHFTFPTIKTKNMGSDYQPVSDDFIAQWRRLLLEDSYFKTEDWMEAMGAENQQAIITGREADELSRKLSLKSSQGGYKVSIVWLPERMNDTSANKLLKLLEEPPAKTVFIMVCEQPELLLETIRSRTQRIDTRRISDSDIEQALISQRGIEPDAAQRMARLADGNWLKALEALRTDSEDKLFFDFYTMLMRQAYMRNVKTLKAWSDSVAALGREKQKRLLSYFLRMTRENFMYNFHNPELNYMTMEEELFAEKFSPYINEANIICIEELFSLAHRDIAQNANAKIVFYELAVKMITLIMMRDEQ
ncbi:MAG: DNA polymerase III subunit delta [Prevotella sp.]|nr:DNA polymerase III subunit delta [Prevotella sp.]